MRRQAVTRCNRLLDLFVEHHNPGGRRDVLETRFQTRRPKSFGDHDVLWLTQGTDWLPAFAGMTETDAADVAEPCSFFSFVRIRR
jgi:hypothetical protein